MDYKAQQQGVTGRDWADKSWLRREPRGPVDFLDAACAISAGVTFALAAASLLVYLYA